MVTPTAGSVVLVPFPFSDLSQSKLRPAVVLADSGRRDWILCQVTSNAYSDIHAVEITDTDFRTGTLQWTSYARPGKIFTANQSLFAVEIGVLTDDGFRRLVGAVIALLQSSLPI